MGFVKSKRVDNDGVVPLRNKNGVIYSDKKMKAEILNEQFSSVFNKEENDNLPDKGHSPYPSMDKITVTRKGVYLLLARTDPHKATGPDGISAQLLKTLADELAPVLQHLFQTSLDQGAVPRAWREAQVVPIFKKGDRNNPANYRPVSLTSICSKYLEHIIRSNVMDHLDSHQILTEAQHGFRKKRSTVSQLIETVHVMLSTLEKQKERDVIFLDFSKAFDKVPHKRLLYKLRHYGIRGKLQQWIGNFLQDRHQQVMVEGATSSPAPVHSGVPQGTVLGPLLFLIYINDLPECISPDSNTGLYADDSSLSKEISPTTDSTKRDSDIKKLQTDLDRLQTWENDWQMEFNANKCQAMRISNKKNPGKPSYFIHGQELEAVDSTKYLGVTINNKLKWNEHIAATARKAEAARAFLSRNLTKCTEETKKQCYTTLVRPILEYASEIWDPHEKGKIKTIERVQKRAARFIKNDYNWDNSATSMVRDLNLQPLEERRAHTKVTTFFKAISGDLEIPTKHLEPLTLTTRGHQRRYRIPDTRLNITKASFYPDAIRLWNRLPTTATVATTLQDFKSAIGPVTFRTAQ